MKTLTVLLPVRNEEKTLYHTLNSLLLQTGLFRRKIIVYNDGSTDGTGKILKAFSNVYDRIKIINNPRKQKDKNHNYARAIYNASLYLEKTKPDYIALLDGDTVLEKKYYLKVLTRLEKDDKIGLSGGKLIGEETGSIIYGLPPQVYGSNRVYTKDLWLKLNNNRYVLKDIIEAIDTYHYLKAFTLGYTPRSFNDIISLSLRPSRKDAKRMFNRGVDCYSFGYYSFFILLRSIKNKSPSMLAGYLKAYLMKRKKLSIEPFIKYSQMIRIKKVLHIPFQEYKITSKQIIKEVIKSFESRRN